MQLTIRLAETFLENPTGVLSIHQIAKRLKIPYGTAYNRIHQMGEMNLVHIVPQGKAKLCALNADNPMTPSLLSMGASQITERFLSARTISASIAGKLRDVLEQSLGDNLQTAILLNHSSIQKILTRGEASIQAWEQSNAAAGTPEVAAMEAVPPGSRSDASLPGGASEAPDQSDTPGFPAETGTPDEDSSLDFFLIMDEELPSIDLLHHSLSSCFPPPCLPKITTMPVRPSTLVGMLREKENEAGFSAYHMIRRGLILLGFERFFSLVLKAFQPRFI